MPETLEARLHRVFRLGPLDPWQLALMLHAEPDDITHLCKLALLAGTIEVGEWHRYEQGDLPAFIERKEFYSPSIQECLRNEF